MLRSRASSFTSGVAAIGRRHLTSKAFGNRAGRGLSGVRSQAANAPRSAALASEVAETEAQVRAKPQLDQAQLEGFRRIVVADSWRHGDADQVVADDDEPSRARWQDDTSDVDAVAAPIGRDPSQPRSEASAAPPIGPPPPGTPPRELVAASIAWLQIGASATTQLAVTEAAAAVLSIHRRLEYTFYRPASGTSQQLSDAAMLMLWRRLIGNLCRFAVAPPSASTTASIDSVKFGKTMPRAAHQQLLVVPLLEACLVFFAKPKDLLRGSGTDGKPQQQVASASAAAPAVKLSPEEEEATYTAMVRDALSVATPIEALRVVGASLLGLPPPTVDDANSESQAVLRWCTHVAAVLGDRVPASHSAASSAGILERTSQIVGAGKAPSAAPSVANVGHPLLPALLRSRIVADPSIAGIVAARVYTLGLTSADLDGSTNLEPHQQATRAAEVQMQHNTTSSVVGRGRGSGALCIVDASAKLVAAERGAALFEPLCNACAAIGDLDTLTRAMFLMYSRGISTDAVVASVIEATLRNPNAGSATDESARVKTALALYTQLVGRTSYSAQCVMASRLLSFCADRLQCASLSGSTSGVVGDDDRVGSDMPSRIFATLLDDGRVPTAECFLQMIRCYAVVTFPFRARKRQDSCNPMHAETPERYSLGESAAAAASREGMKLDYCAAVLRVREPQKVLDLFTLYHRSAAMQRKELPSVQVAAVEVAMLEIALAAAVSLRSVERAETALNLHNRAIDSLLPTSRPAWERDARNSSAAVGMQRSGMTSSAAKSAARLVAMRAAALKRPTRPAAEPSGVDLSVALEKLHVSQSPFPSVTSAAMRLLAELVAASPNADLDTLRRLVETNVWQRLRGAGAPAPEVARRVANVLLALCEHLGAGRHATATANSGRYFVLPSHAVHLFAAVVSDATRTYCIAPQGRVDLLPRSALESLGASLIATLQAQMVSSPVDADGEFDAVAKLGVEGLALAMGLGINSPVLQAAVARSTLLSGCNVAVLSPSVVKQLLERGGAAARQTTGSAVWFAKALASQFATFANEASALLGDEEARRDWVLLVPWSSTQVAPSTSCSALGKMLRDQHASGGSVPLKHFGAAASVGEVVQVRILMIPPRAPFAYFSGPVTPPSTGASPLPTVPWLLPDEAQTIYALLQPALANDKRSGSSAAAVLWIGDGPSKKPAAMEAAMEEDVGRLRAPGEGQVDGDRVLYSLLVCASTRGLRGARVCRDIHFAAAATNSTSASGASASTAASAAATPSNAKTAALRRSDPTAESKRLAQTASSLLSRLASSSAPR